MRLALGVSLYDTYKIILDIPTLFLFGDAIEVLVMRLKQSRQIAKDLPRGAIEPVCVA